MKKLFFTIAAACGCAFFAYSEQVQSWFSGGVASSAPASVNGAWTSPSEGETTNVESFTLELGYDETLDFTPTANAAPDTNVVTRVTSEVVFVPAESELPEPPSGTKIAFMVSNTVYCAYANGAWVKLEGATPPSDPGDAVVVLFEVDYKRSAPRARCGIVADDGATTNYLKAVGAADGSWLALGGSTPTPALVGKVSFCGEGEVVAVRGDVQMGVFGNDGIKFGTSGEAVTNALAGTDHTVTVLRDNTEKIVIPAEASVAVTVDSNGHTAGGIDNKSSIATEVKVEIPQATVAQGSGSYTNEVNVTGNTTIKVTTSDASKDAYGCVFTGSDNKTYLEVRVQTSAAVMSNVVFGADNTMLADPTNLAYRTFLRKYCGAQDGAYMKANTKSADIIEQLSTNGGNSLPLWQSYVLGLNANTGKLATQPTGTDNDQGNLHIAIPDVHASESGFSVTYKMNNGTSETTIDDPANIQIPVGTGTYSIKAVLTPKPAPQN